jgi:hypothetical protein
VKSSLNVLEVTEFALITPSTIWDITLTMGFFTFLNELGFFRLFPFLFNFLPVDDEGVTFSSWCSSLWSSSYISIGVLSAVTSWPGMQVERPDARLLSNIIVISSTQFEGPKRYVFFSLCICPYTKNIEA